MLSDDHFLQPRNFAHAEAFPNVQFSISFSNFLLSSNARPVNTIACASSILAPCEGNDIDEPEEGALDGPEKTFPNDQGKCQCNPLHDEVRHGDFGNCAVRSGLRNDDGKKYHGVKADLRNCTKRQADKPEQLMRSKIEHPKQVQPPRGQRHFMTLQFGSAVQTSHSWDPQLLYASDLSP